MKLCECGCNKLVKKNQRFIWGHNRKGCGTNNLGIGWKHKSETIEKLRRAHSEEHNRNVSKAKKGVLLSEKHKESLRISHLGKPSQNTLEGNLKIAETIKKVWGSRSKEEKEKIGKKIGEKTKGRIPWNFGKTGEYCQSEETKKKHKNRWKDIVYRDKQLKLIFESKKPNKLELKFQKFLDENFTNEWKYVGAGEIWIAGKCPDFWNMNGRKQLIELFGSYFHKPEDEEIRKSHFAKYGYQTLVIWDREFTNKNKNNLVEKIRRF